MKKLFAIFGLLSASVAHAGELDAHQIADELIGQSLSWWNNSGWESGNLVLMPGGKATITVETPHLQRDRGQWIMRGNEICTMWTSLREQKQKCYSLKEVEPGHFVSSGGNEFRINGAGV